MTESEWPLTVDQAVNKILSVLTPEQQKTMRDTPYERLITFHHGMGTWIRNQFGLWRGNSKLFDDCGTNPHDPDGASFIIIQAVWQRLRDLSSGEPSRSQGNE